MIYNWCYNYLYMFMMCYNNNYKQMFFFIMFYKGSTIIMYHKLISLENIIITFIILYNVIIIYYKCYVK